MERRKLGKSGINVSRLALGTMTWGRDTDEHEAAEQLRLFIDNGGNFIDTAAIYGDGDAERVLGGLVNAMANREEIFIASKAGIVLRNGERSIDNSRTALIADLDRSLKRLQTDYLDLWQIHRWDVNTPIEETLSAMDFAVTSGRVRYLGISNFAGWQTALSCTLQNPSFGKASIISTQSEYSLLNRKVEEEIVPAADQLGIGILAWSPLRQIGRAHV